MRGVWALGEVKHLIFDLPSAFSDISISTDFHDKPNKFKTNVRLLITMPAFLETLDTFFML